MHQFGRPWRSRGLAELLHLRPKSSRHALDIPLIVLPEQNLIRAGQTLAKAHVHAEGVVLAVLQRLLLQKPFLDIAERQGSFLGLLGS